MFNFSVVSFCQNQVSRIITLNINSEGECSITYLYTPLNYTKTRAEDINETAWEALFATLFSPGGNKTKIKELHHEFIDDKKQVKFTFKVLSFVEKQNKTRIISANKIGVLKTLKAKKASYKLDDNVVHFTFNSTEFWDVTFKLEGATNVTVNSATYSIKYDQASGFGFPFFPPFNWKPKEKIVLPPSLPLALIVPLVVLMALMLGVIVKTAMSEE